MALDIPVEAFMALLGKGSEIIAFPGLPVPYCYRGYHIQEMILFALARGYAVTPVELVPLVLPPAALHPNTRQPYEAATVFHGETEESNRDIFNKIILTCRGVLEGVLAPLPSKLLQRGHAVAFERGVIFDPSSDAFMYSVRECEARHFYANCAWRIDKMEVSYAAH
jgi:hypothetical protein